MANSLVLAATGGLVIGGAAVFLLLLNGRIFGVSGILYGWLNPAEPSRAWRGYLLAGLALGGLLTAALTGLPLTRPNGLRPELTLLAGVLVGFGAVLGSGCTSGHGVCGVGRLAPRSLFATAVFIGCGMLTVYLLKQAGFP